MRIEMDGKDLPAGFVALFPVDAAAWTVKTTPEGTAKTAPDGSTLYRCASAKVVALDADGRPEREESNASVAVLKPCALKAGEVARAVGRVWVTHYVTNGGRLGVSIIAESLAAGRVDGEDAAPRLAFGGKGGDGR